MLKTICLLAALVLATVCLAAEDSATDKDDWWPSFQKSRPSRSIQSSDWVDKTWQPETNPITSLHHQWSPQEEERVTASWEPQSPNSDSFGFDPRNLEESLGNSEVTFDLLRQRGRPWMTKRQTPSRLGSVLGLYEDVFQGSSPFVVTPENQVLPLDRDNHILPVNTENQIVPVKPERRSGRRPAACSFGPFGLVCRNAARRGDVMRQRSTRYTQ